MKPTFGFYNIKSSELGRQGAFLGFRILPHTFLSTLARPSVSLLLFFCTENGPQKSFTATRTGLSQTGAGSTENFLDAQGL